MRRLLVTITMMLGFLCAHAQGNSLFEHLAAGDRIEFSFSSDLISGTLCAEGGSYLIQAEDYTVACDGTVRLTLDKSSKEAVYENVSGQNPVKMYSDKISVLSQGQDSMDLQILLEEDTPVRFFVTGITIKKPEGTIALPQLPRDYVVTDLR